MNKKQNKKLSSKTLKKNPEVSKNRKKKRVKTKGNWNTCGVFFNNKIILKFIIIMLLITLADQLSKIYIEAFLLNELHNTYEILPFFNFSLAYNYGISFSMFGDVGSDAKFWFIGISSIIILILLYFLYSDGDIKLQNKRVIPIALIVSGAINNIIDRIRVGAVVDFLDFHIGHWHYPVFNVADSVVVIGVGILAWQNLIVNGRVDSKRIAK